MMDARLEHFTPCNDGRLSWVGASSHPPLLAALRIGNGRAARSSMDVGCWDPLRTLAAVATIFARKEDQKRIRQSES
jgi:hypothetical protein